MLEHPDRADRVERPVVDVAVVLQPDLDPVAEPRLGDPLRRQLGLALRHRHADRAHAVVLGRVHHHAAPAAPDVEQAHARLQVELPADQLVLRGLRGFEAGVRRVPHRARVGHRRSEHDPVEVVGHVVVVRDRGRVARRQWRRPRRRASSFGGGGAVAGPRRGREPDRVRATGRGRSAKPLGSRLAQLERREQVALDVDVAGDVRAAEAELARRGDDAAYRVGRLHDERGGRIVRARRGCRRRPRTPMGRSGPRTPVTRSAIGHGLVRSRACGGCRNRTNRARKGNASAPVAATAGGTARSRPPRARGSSARARSIASRHRSRSSDAARARSASQGLPRAVERVEVGPGADREAGEEPGAERRRLLHRRHLDRLLGRVGERLHERRVARHPAVDAQDVDRCGRASVSAASTRSAPRWATPSSTARTSSGRPVPRVRPSTVPRAPKSHCGVPSPSSAGTKTTPPVSAHCCATSWLSSARRDDPEVVAQPLDVRARREHDRLEAPGVRAAEPPGDDRERAAARRGSRTRAGPGRGPCRASRRCRR